MPPRAWNGRPSASSSSFAQAAGRPLDPERPAADYRGLTVAAIETHDLAREFEGGIRAVDGVDLEVAEGEIYGFLGPNGAGKTTTVRMLTTLLRPTGGRAIVAGFDVAEDPGTVREKIGVALQEAALDPLMTGRELLLLQATLHGIAKKEGKERGQRLLDRVGLTLAADRRVGT